MNSVGNSLVRLHSIGGTYLPRITDVDESEAEIVVHVQLELVKLKEKLDAHRKSKEGSRSSTNPGRRFFVVLFLELGGQFRPVRYLRPRPAARKAPAKPTALAKL